MKKYLLMTAIATLMAAVFCEPSYAQKKTRKELKAEAAAAADSIAALEASIEDGAVMTFKYTEHNFGNKESGSDVSYDFEFVNTGKSDIIITNVSTSCGCTTPEWTKQPVPSKSRGVIKVKYDSNRIGNFSKTITVYSNAKNSPVVLSIKGNIQVKQQQ
ncbi:MAG: DUF1573 domain-containing protein [Bacteroidales bacterium]|jgi:hypothetical protein|nr:DUF1573 domain-containing protein [Bacteroidales bacterium]MBR6278927.1 DUF1573 domain-containing protein [Bacteroidales bacterium]